MLQYWLVNSGCLATSRGPPQLLTQPPCQPLDLPKTQQLGSPYLAGRGPLGPCSDGRVTELPVFQLSPAQGTGIKYERSRPQEQTPGYTIFNI